MYVSKSPRLPPVDEAASQGRRRWASLPGADGTLEKRMKRARLLGSAVALCGLCLLAACDETQTQAKSGAAPPPQVAVETVALQDLPVENEFAGRTAGSREVEIRARVEGILLERTYVEGARVQKGDTLFRIDPEPYEVALQHAEAGLEEAKARQRAAARDWERVRVLFANRTVSATRRDESQSELEMSRADVALAEAGVKAARIDLNYTTVEAPISGMTGREALSEGSLVGTDSDNSLLTRLTQLDPIYVNFAIPDAEWMRQRALIASGRLISVSGDRLGAELHLADGQTYPQQGYVDFTDTTVDRRTGTIQARAVFPNAEDMLLPGQFVRIRLKGLVRMDSVVVPEAAVMQGPQGTFVYRVAPETDVAEVVPVTTGPTVSQGWVIEEGLKPGDRIVVEGVLRVRPGQPVSVAPAPGQVAQRKADDSATR